MDLFLDDELLSDKAKREAKLPKHIQDNLPQSVNFVEDLEVAFKFFDAVYEGVKTLGKEISEKDRRGWDNAKAYLDVRR